ncbi:MAG: hypothetical protein IT379_14900 [Deltaproteobacteria bacterium]|nr:hypothetical protein [Deltaproteobacteria bacterium]
MTTWAERLRQWFGRPASVPAPASASGGAEEAPRLARVLLIAIAALVLPIIGLVLYASGSTPGTELPIDDFWRRLAAAALTPAGPMAIGALVGFLFGIPKANRDAVEGEPKQERQHVSGMQRLIELSEWGIKLLLGAGLTQLRWLQDSFEGTAERLALALGPQPSAHAVAWTSLGYFLAWGFFASFLATRLWLLGELARVDRIASLQKRLAEEKANRDAAAGRAKQAEQKLKDVAEANVQVLEASRQGTQSSPAAIAAPAELSRKTVESLVFSALYQSAPDGFRRAIAIGEEYLANHPEGTESNADLNMYLACAHGQAHAYEKARLARSEELRRHREGALRAANAAISAAPETRDLLRAFLKAGPGEIDNDLASFAGDSEFEKLLAEPIA